MANLKFSQFNNTAPSATTSFLVGYDTLLNDNIRFKESDLDLADMGGLLDLGVQVTGQLDLSTNSTGTIDLATQVTGLLDLSTNSTGTIDLATQSSGTLAEANGGSGVAQLYLNNQVGARFLKTFTWKNSGQYPYGNVPRGTEYVLPFPTLDVEFSNLTGTTAPSEYQFNLIDTSAATPVGIPTAAPFLSGENTYIQFATAAWNGGLTVNSVYRISGNLFFFDLTADLDVSIFLYTYNNTGSTQKFLIAKASFDEASDSQSIFFERNIVVPAGLSDMRAYIAVLFANGSSDPYPASQDDMNALNVCVEKII